jgi:hypothetical protein
MRLWEQHKEIHHMKIQVDMANDLRTLASAATPPRETQIWHIITYQSLKSKGENNLRGVIFT